MSPAMDAAGGPAPAVAPPARARAAPSPQDRPVERRVSVTRAVTRFVAAGVAAAVLIAAGAFLVVSRSATAEAMRNAEEVTRIDARGIVEPALTTAAVRGDPAALAALDAVVRGRVLSDRVLRVKIWAGDGRIVYSDEPRLIGDTYTLGAEEQSALRTGTVTADVTDLSRPENRFENPNRKLLEVYLPISAPSGPLLFETYQQFTTVADDQRRIFMSFLPVVLGGLALLLIIQVPLAWRLARRLEHARVQREELIQRAIDASEAERRSIARDLHDGVVQNMVGTSYRLVAESERLRGGATGQPERCAGVMSEAAEEVRRAARDLRTLIIEIAPPTLQDEGGLSNAVADLLAPLAQRGVTTSLEVTPVAGLRPEHNALLFRVVQEGLRNAARYARATRVAVRVGESAGGVMVEVEDDGRGFTLEERRQRGRQGHVGLDLLGGLLTDAGGVLTVTSAPGTGTRLRAEVPLS